MNSRRNYHSQEDHQEEELQGLKNLRKEDSQRCGNKQVLKFWNKLILKSKIKKITLHGRAFLEPLIEIMMEELLSKNLKKLLRNLSIKHITLH